MSHKLFKTLMRLWESVVEYKDSADRQLSAIFMVLPTRKELPDYYQIIKKPIDLKKMRDRILKHRYLSLDDMEVDFTLLCDNARVYNLEGSQIHQDATALESVFVEYKAKFESGELEVSDSEPEGEGDLDSLPSDDDDDVSSRAESQSSKTKSKKTKRSRRGKKGDRIPMIIDSDYEDSRDSFVSSSFVNSPSSSVTSLSQAPSPSSVVDRQQSY